MRTGFLMALLVTVQSVYALDGADILRKVDDMWRGKSSAGIMTMHVKTAHWERSLKMKVYSLGTDLTLVRIVEPKQEAGTGTLKDHDKIWNYLPKTRRVMKIPSSMMMGSWMGSHFTNDDLVQESRLAEDYLFEVEESETNYRITLTPKPDAPVVWGEIVLDVKKDPLLPVTEEYFDEEGSPVRKASFLGPKMFGDRLLPSVIRMQPEDNPDEFTEITYEKLLFDIDLEEAFFSIQNLKRR